MSIPKSLAEKIGASANKWVTASVCFGGLEHIVGGKVAEEHVQSYIQGAEAMYALLLESAAPAYQIGRLYESQVEALLSARDTEIERLKEEIEDLQKSMDQSGWCP